MLDKTDKPSIFIACFMPFIVLICATNGIDIRPPEPVRHEYELLSIYPYVDTITNNYGGVIDQDLKYVVIYTDGENIYQNKGFCPEEGDVFHINEDGNNKYIVVNHMGGTYEGVSLSKEMFKDLGLQK